MQVTITDDMKLKYNVPPTMDKLVEQNIYLKTVNRGQAVSIAYLEQENEQLISDALKLARENDILTGMVFESPFAMRNEYTA